MARIIVVVGTSATRITTYRNTADIVERFDELKTHPNYDQWFTRLTAKLQTVLGGNKAEPNRIMVVVPCALRTDDTIVSMGPGHTAWHGKQIHTRLRDELQVQAYVVEAGVALMASESSQTTFPHVSICWDTSITAATTSTGTDYLPIAAGHLPRTGQRDLTCGCGGIDCVDLTLSGSALARRYGDIESLEQYMWAATIESFQRYVIAPLAIGRPGASFVIGGSVFVHAAINGFSVATTARQWMEAKFSFVTPCLFSEPAARDPLTDGGLVLLAATPPL